MNWPKQDTLYPLTLDTYTKELTLEVRTEIKQNTIEALQKWHSPGTSLARIYPLERDWKEGLMISQMGKKDNLISYIFESFIFNIVKGIREDRETISKYFIQLQKLEDLHKFLMELREDIDQPFFPLPKYSIST